MLPFKQRTGETCSVSSLCPGRLVVQLCCEPSLALEKLTVLDAVLCVVLTCKGEAGERW